MRTPTPARLRADSVRRDITVPWSRNLQLSLGDRWVSLGGCPGGGAVPERAAPGSLAQDPRGERVAYRCSAGGVWGLVYAGPGFAWQSCAPPLAPGPVDWSRVPDLVGIAPTMASCPGVPFEALATEVRRRGGGPALSQLLAATLTHGAEESAWQQVYRSLPAATRSPLQARARELLVSEPPSLATKFDRLARVADVETAGLTPDRLRTLVWVCEPRPGYTGCTDLFRRLARVAPDEASYLACEQVVRRNLYPTEVAALAHGQWRCEEFRTRAERSNCVAFSSNGLRCGVGATAHPCTRENYLAEVKAELAPGGPTAEVPGGYFAYGERLLAAAAIAQGASCAPFSDGGL